MSIEVRDPNGRSVRVRRLWWPYRRVVNKRTVETFDGPDTTMWMSDLDDPISLFIAACALVLMLPLLVVLFVGFAEVLLLLPLIPLYLLGRIALRRPWRLEVTREKRVVYRERVVGWRASRERMEQLAFRYEAGLPA